MLGDRSEFRVVDLLELKVSTQDELHLECLAGRRGIFRQIKVPDINRPGFALSGFLKDFASERIQLFGRGEVAYLEKMKSEEEIKCKPIDSFKLKIRQLLKTPIPCCVFSNAFVPDDEILEVAEDVMCPIFRTSLSSSEFTVRLLRILYNVFSPRLYTHGDLVDVFDVGVLITGASGIGKSEVTLELIDRGHRLVADDSVFISCLNGNTLIGKATNEETGYCMEIRGLGLLDIKALYGITAVREAKKIDIMVHLEEWNSNKMYERLDAQNKKENLLGVEIPRLELPVKTGRNVSILIEIAAKKEKLKMLGQPMDVDFMKGILKAGQVESNNYYSKYDSY